MPKKNPNSAAAPATVLDRRRFLGQAGAGAGLLAALGVDLHALARGAPAGAPGSAAAAASPPEPKVSQPPPLADLEGKVAYITAAADGIGLGVARACSYAGMRVAIGYRDAQRLEAALPLFHPDNSGVVPIRHDVTDRDGWKRVLQQIQAKYGNLHLLVNNASVGTPARAVDADAELWDNAVAVNFTGIFNGVAACLPHMLAHGEGAHIVTIASLSGLLPGGTAGVYTATKMGAVGIMEALRVELESATVGTSVFCPGLVNTANAPAAPGTPAGATAALPAAGMDPLEAGARVLNGVVNNDLFILSHPEFKQGMQERFSAILASDPPMEVPYPRARVEAEAPILHTGIYRREILHRRKRRRSYRTA
ncbi:MAG TPA: SDR family NAD(P)-dependent oxidoreductase [Steroidobacteraceae bacterium]|nr:SDR family NAD(P)-dependent oxidoreductase [Steroidobacteraceae bacterium]